MKATNRTVIQHMFDRCQYEGKKAFIGYLTAGYPTMEDTKAYVHALERGGADLIELGIPFSDPLADGPVIQGTSQAALEAGATVDKILEATQEIRQHTTIPLLYMVYINPLLSYGLERFVTACVQIGIDGLIVPDLPYEEKEELEGIMRSYHLPLIPLVAPTSKERIRDIVKDCNGFVYCVSSLGVTGNKELDFRAVSSYMQEVKGYTDAPLAIGFGISSKEDIDALSDDADGLIVGSAIMRFIGEHRGDVEGLEGFVRSFVE